MTTLGSHEVRCCLLKINKDSFLADIHETIFYKQVANVYDNRIIYKRISFSEWEQQLVMGPPKRF